MSIGSCRRDKFVHHFEAELLMSFLSASKPEFHAYFDIVAEKVDRVRNFDGEVMGIDDSSELNLLQLIARILRVFLPLGFLVTELAVIYNSAHRRLGVGRDLDQIEVFTLCDAERIRERHDTQGIRLLVQDSNFSCSAFSVAPMCRFTWWPRPRREATQ